MKSTKTQPLIKILIDLEIFTFYFLGGNIHPKYHINCSDFSQLATEIKRNKDGLK